MIYVRQHLRFFLLMCLALAIWAASATVLLFQSIRLDESQSLWVAIQSPQSLLTWVSEDVHVPLYHILLHVFLTITDFSLTNARLFSSIWYLASLPIIYLLGLHVSGKKVALLAVFLSSLSPFLLWYAFEVRMYTMFLFFSSVQLLAFVRLIQSNFQQHKFIFVLSSSLGLYTHYFFIFQIIAQALYFIGGNLYQLSRQRFNLQNLHHQLKSSYQLTGLYFLAGLTLTPWLYFIYSQGNAVATKPLIPPPNTYTLFQTITQLLFGFQTTSFVNITISLWPLTLVVLFYLFTKRARAPILYSGLLLMMVLAPLGIVYAASHIQPLFLTRYFMLITPALIILISWFIQSYRQIASVLLTIILSTVLVSSLLWQNTNAQSPVKENYAHAATYLHENASAYDVIAVSAPFTIYPLEFYYQGTTRVVTIPDWDRYNGQPIQSFDQDQFQTRINELRNQYRMIHMVLSYDQGYEQQIVGFMDSNYELIHAKQVSEGLQVRSYKLRY